MPHLFEPLALRDVTLPNRIGIPPMCQYSAHEGMAADWHFVHYGSRAVGGAGLLIVEATAVVPEGRISPGDLGLWHDAQIEPLARIAGFIRQYGGVPAIQLAHAGRKASVGLGWQAQRTLLPAEGGWTPLAPSAVAFADGYATPAALDEAAIVQIITRFSEAARRAGIASASRSSGQGRGRRPVANRGGAAIRGRAGPRRPARCARCDRPARVK